MPFAHLKTGRFHYEVFGDKQLPAVLLIMGLGMPGRGLASELYFHASWKKAFASSPWITEMQAYPSTFLI